MARDEKPIKRTTGKGGNYRKTSSGAGMTKKGVAAYRKCCCKKKEVLLCEIGRADEEVP